MGTTTYREFLELPSLLRFLLTFEFLLPQLALRRRQNDGLSGGVGNLSCLKPFLKFPNLPLFAFDLLPTLFFL